jgi:phosphatidylglycerol:prolipoprotein diacylglycerol transferase
MSNILLRQDRLWPGGKAPFSPQKTDDLLLYMTLGVLLGGRLGYVLFYEPRFFLSRPWEIPAILERRHGVPRGADRLY